MSTDFRTILAEALQKAVANIKKAVDDLQPVSFGLTPGSAITAEQARTLPAGATFRDSDGDVWIVADEGGFTFDAEDQFPTTLDPANYYPLTLVSLPAPKPELATDPVAETTETVNQDELADWEKELLGVKPYHVKPGDLVRMTEGVNSYEPQIGTVGKLRSIEVVSRAISKTGVRYLVEGSGFFAGDVEKVIIAVGDHVRVTKDFFPHRTEFLGKEGIVTQLNKPRFRQRAEVPFVLDIDGADWYMAEVVPVTTPTPEPEPTPAAPEPLAAVGDRVLVTKVNNPVVRWREGHEGTVERMDEETALPVVIFNGGGRVVAAVTEPVPAPEPEPDTSQLRLVDIDGDVLEVSYMGHSGGTGRYAAKIHTNRSNRRDFSSVYVTDEDLATLIARLQAFQKARQAA